ncbi:MAG: 16S rRNA (guanine(966)-N(2))-methyltransferase RsmD [Candidatus Dormibacteria bacterium]
MAQTRITAGAWRGRLIDTPPGLGMRPTRSMVREALFNILGGRVVDAHVVDLYAGAGSLGFEALSRGAASATFVERHRGALDLIGHTAERLGCAGRVRIVAADVIDWLRRRPVELHRAHICLVDAPYRDQAVLEALRLLGEAPPPLVVCEHHHARTLPDEIGGLRVFRQARYGLTDLSLYQGKKS